MTRTSPAEPRSPSNYEIRDTRYRGGARNWLTFLALLAIAACDGSQSVSLTAEDFRFTPDLIRVNAAGPVSLSIYNAGREVHEFDSPLLMYAPATADAKAGKGSGANGILLRPGQSVTIAAALPPGTYLYICRRKGHQNMTGTLIVE